MKQLTILIALLMFSCTDKRQEYCNERAREFVQSLDTYCNDDLYLGLTVFATEDFHCDCMFTMKDGKWTIDKVEVVNK